MNEKFCRTLLITQVVIGNPKTSYKAELCSVGCCSFFPIELFPTEHAFFMRGGT
jgi:hypothetical protein